MKSKIKTVNTSSENPASPVFKNVEGKPDTPSFIHVNPQYVVAITQFNGRAQIHMHASSVTIDAGMCCPIMLKSYLWDDEA